MLGLELLEYGRHIAARENVAGQQQDRYAVDGSRGGPGNHVGCSGADGGRTGEGGQAVSGLGETGGDVNGRLFIAAKVVAEIRVLLQRLRQPGYVAMPENAPCAAEKAMFAPVPGNILVLEKAHQSLSHRNATCLHAIPPRFGEPEAAKPLSRVRDHEKRHGRSVNS